MKSSRKKKPAAARSTPPRAAAQLACVLDEVAARLEPLLAGFDKPIAAEAKRLLKLTTALRNDVGVGRSRSSRRKRG